MTMNEKNVTAEVEGSVRTKIRGTRPFLFETDEMLAFSFAKAKAGVEPWASAFARTKKHADDAPAPAPFTGSSATQYRLRACQELIYARYHALTFLGTGEQKYFDGAMAFLNAYVRSTPMLGSDETLDYSAPAVDGKPDIGLNIAAPMTALCEVYALLYPYLTDSDKEAVKNWVRVGAELIKKGHEYWTGNDYYDHQYGNNHLSSHLMGLIAAAYAIEDDSLLSYALDAEKNPAHFAEMIERAILMKGDEVWYRDIDSDVTEGEIYDRYRVVQNNGFFYAVYHLKFLTNGAVMLMNNGLDYFSFVGKNGENLLLPYHAYEEYLVANTVEIGNRHYVGSPMCRSVPLFSYHMANYYYNDERVDSLVRLMLDAGEISWDKETFGDTAVFVYTKG